MATHTDYKKFAVKYNREFKIAGVHKMKKADLINAIEERLSKSRKEIRDEYKQLKEMKKENKTPTISDDEIKSKFVLGMSYMKLLGASMGGKLNDNELQQQLKKSQEASKIFRKKKLTKEQKDIINEGLKNIKDLIKTNKENKKTKKEPAPKPKQKKTTVKKEPQKPKFKIDQSKQPKTTPSKIIMSQKPALNTKKIIKKEPKKEPVKEESKTVTKTKFPDWTISNADNKKLTIASLSLNNPEIKKLYDRYMKNMIKENWIPLRRLIVKLSPPRPKKIRKKDQKN